VEAVRPAERRLHRQERPIYVADSESNNAQNPGFQSAGCDRHAKDGKVTALIPDPGPVKGQGPVPAPAAPPKALPADAAGNVYGAEVDARKLVRYEKK